MNKPAISGLTAIGLLLLGAHDARAAGVLEDLLAADRAFAAAAAESGAQAAFLDFLAPDAVLFRPTAVNGHDWLQTHEEASGRLDWSPAAGAVACDGQLAFTVGPWTYRQDTANSGGVYLTVWRRDAGGDWMVALDHGIDGPAAPKGGAGGALDVLTGHWRAAGDRACGGVADDDGLAEADRRLNDMMRSAGADAALRRFVGGQPVMFRDGHVPAVIAAEWPRDDASLGPGIGAVADGAMAGPGSDLGCTYGRIVTAGLGGGASAARAVYVRLWARAAGQWVLAADMMTALPVLAAAPASQ